MVLFRVVNRSLTPSANLAQLLFKRSKSKQTKPSTHLFFPQPSHPAANATQKFPTSLFMKLFYCASWKCGSLFIFRFSKKIAEMTGTPLLSPNFKSDAPHYLKQSDIAAYQFSQMSDYICSPVRSARFLPETLKSSDVSIIVHLRDPRDMLVSSYFSVAFSHPKGPSLKISDENRQKLRDTSIDEYVLKQRKRLQNIFEDFMELSRKRSDLLLVTYEEMVCDFPNYVHKIGEHIGLTDQQQELLINQFSDEFIIEEENHENHKRRVIPGDHREKLQESTTTELTEAFASHLDWLYD